MTAKRFVLAVATLAMALVAQGAHAQCPSSDPGCTEYTGGSTKTGFFRISIPSSWNGDLILVNHGFDLDPTNINPHRACKKNNAPCVVDGDCAIVGDVCNEIDLFGFDEYLLPQGIAVAASTYSETGWSVFASRKDLKAILKYMKKTPGLGAPARTFVSGFSMGGAVTLDWSIRANPKGTFGIAPLCPAAAGGLASWDAATDLRMAFDYACAGVTGAFFSGPVDQSGEDAFYPTQTQIAIKFDACFGNLLGSPTTEEQARYDEWLVITGHTGSPLEAATLMGFATQGMYDTVQPKKKLGRKPIAYNPYGQVTYADAAFDAGVERFPEYPKGRKKLGKNYDPNYLKGKAAKVTYPIVSLANDDDYLTIPGMNQVIQSAWTAGGKDYTTAWVNGGGHCNFTEFEVNATVQSMLDWADTGTQPSAADIETACLALPGASAGDCDFDQAFTVPAFTDRVPARPDWPDAAK
jgi:hypothetical protein